MLVWRNGSIDHTWPIKPIGLLGGGRSLTDRRTGGGDAQSPNGDVDRNGISIVS